jgi:hypothetical protein
LQQRPVAFRPHADETLDSAPPRQHVSCTACSDAALWSRLCRCGTTQSPLHQSLLPRGVPLPTARFSKCAHPAQPVPLSAQSGAIRSHFRALLIL